MLTFPDGRNNNKLPPFKGTVMQIDYQGLINYILGVLKYPESFAFQLSITFQ